MKSLGCRDEPDHDPRDKRQASLRALDVRDVRLLDGKVHAVRAEAVSITGAHVSAVNGAHHLERVVVDRSQLIQLAAALAAELNVTFGDDLDD